MGRLTDKQRRTLEVLPPPAARSVGIPLMRARDVVEAGADGYPVLDELRALGLATSSRGWWRRTREGERCVRNGAR